MKQKFISLLFAIMVGSCMLFAEKVQIGDLYYNLNAQNKTAEVTSQNSNNPYWTEIITTADIPSSIDYNGETYSVTSIGMDAFCFCSNLESVTIPNSVTSIGKWAFEGCSSLTSMIIPNSVTNIYYRAFRNCSNMTSVFIGNSVTDIEKQAFSGCDNLTSVTLNSDKIVNSGPSSIFGTEVKEYIIGNDVTSIRSYAFYGYSGMTSVIIGNSVTDIGEYAFSGCDNLTSVSISNSVTSIGEKAFYGCISLPVYDNVRYADTYLVEAVNKSLSSHIIKEGTKWIGPSAFSSCTGLTSVTIPNSVTSIGYDAFYGCLSLTSVHINDIAAWCGISFTYEFPHLLANPLMSAQHLYMDGKEITELIIPEGVTSIGNIAFYCCLSLTSVTIPLSVTSIGEYAFSGCDNLTSVTIPNSVTSIRDYAFAGCDNLTSVTIPNSVTSIGNYAFTYCSNLTSIEIPNNVTSIGSSAFSNCNNLKNVILGSSVKVIESYAFDDCSAIETITCYSQRPPTVKEKTFEGVSYSVIVYVPANYLDTYKKHDAWGLYDVRAIGAGSADVNDVNVTPADNSVEVVWPAVNGAATYELVIKDKEGNVICTLIFNANGQLTQIAFNAPSQNGAPQQTQASGFSFTVTGLDAGTSYNLSITAKDENGATLDVKKQSFHTDWTTAIDEVTNNENISHKIIRDGQVFIQRGDKLYTLQGQEAK